MPFNFSEGLTHISDQLNIENGSSNLENEFSLIEESDRAKESIITNPLDFKKITIAYMNEEAEKYGYPDIFAAMALKNSSIPELVAEGASWTEFFDAGMTFIDYEIKTENYLTFDKSTVSIQSDSLSPKVTFTPVISIDPALAGLPIAGGEVVRTILSGTGPPSPYDGSTGDFWIDTVNNTIYGPAIWVYDRNDDGIPDLSGGELIPAPLSSSEAINYWGDPTSLIGPTGPCCTGEQGAQGFQGSRGNTILSGTGQPSPIDGVSGDFWLNTTTNILYGPAIGLGEGSVGWFSSSATLLKGTTGSQGFQGFQGLIGPTGAPGEAADKGETGSQGFQGFQGLQGFQGFQGVQGVQGNTGPAGKPGTDGNQGSQGPTGGAEPVGNNNEIQYRYGSSLSANALSTIVTNQNLIPSSGYSGNFVHYTESITAYSYADAITGTDNELVIPFGVCNTFTVDNIMLNDSLTLLTITGFTQMSTGESMTLILGHTGVNGSRIEIPRGNNIWWSGGVIGGVGSTSSIYPTSNKKYDIITFFSDGYRIFGSYSLNYTQ